MRKFLFIIFYTVLIAAVISSVFFLFKVREREHFLAELIAASGAARADLTVEETVLTLSDHIYNRTRNNLELKQLDLYSRLESTSPFNVTSAVALRYGGFGIEGHSTYGPCGTMSRTLLNALWTLDIPARELQLFPNDEGKGGGHTMVEFFASGRWLVISPSDNSFVWRKPGGEIATAAEIRDDKTIFAGVFDQDPDYPYRFDNYGNIRWEKLPPVVTTVIKKVIGEERYENASTPRLYDKPRTLFFIASLAAVVVCYLLAYVSRPRSRPAPRRSRIENPIPR